MTQRSDPPPLLARLTALGDLARLRILRLLESNELSVGELARATQLPQSTVSRHLKLLHDGRWVVKRSAGTASLYRLVELELETGANDLWRVAREQLGTSPTLDEDDRRLCEVLAERRADSREFFGRLGGEWDELRRELFGAHFTSEAALALVPRDWVIADLGCGTGNAAALLAPHVARVIAIDREPAMLDAARKRLTGATNVEFRNGDLLAPPLAPGEVDVAMICLVLHHVDDPTAAISAAAAGVRSGGILMVVDMVVHDREDYRHTMGHLHLGFSAADVQAWSAAAGCSDVRYRPLRPDTLTRGPSLFVATMVRHEGGGDG